MIRKVLLGLCALAASMTVLASSAGSVIPPQGKIGHNQYFEGLVNGQTGVTSPAVIQMACFGPIRPGQTGHPLAGQTVEVLLPEVILASDGFTGPTANRIIAFFNAPPPPPVNPSKAKGSVTFRRYGTPLAIPTSLVLPCAGTGNVYFVPFPASPIGPARDAVVPVAYEGQP